MIDNLTCDDCGKVFNCKRGYCGHKAHCGKKIEEVKCDICEREMRKEHFDKHKRCHSNDKECLECGDTIFFFENRTKFCSSSCSAKYNNRDKKKSCKCLNCGEEIIAKSKANRKYCNHKCQWDYTIRNKFQEFESSGVIPTPHQRRKYFLAKYGNQCRQAVFG